MSAHEIDILLIAALFLRNAADMRKKLIGNEGQIVPSAQIHTMEIAHGALDVARVTAGRRLRYVAHSATDGAASKQSSLRAAQYFDALQIHQIELATHGGRVVDVVYIDGNARLEREVEIVLADATDECRQRVAKGCLRGPEARIRNVESNICGC